MITTVEVKPFKMPKSFINFYEGSIYYSVGVLVVTAPSIAISEVFQALAIELKLPYKRTNNSIEIGYSIDKG